MRLIISNQVIEDFDVRTEAAITFSLANITDIDKESTGYTKTIKVPITPQTRKIFGAPEDIHNITFFNQQKRMAVIEDEGVIVMSGTCMLKSSEFSKLNAGYYSINIIGAGKEWAVNAATRKQSETNMNISEVFNEQTILDSWNGKDKIVRWLPVVRQPFSYVEKRETITRDMNQWDYHPFINIKKMFLQIFKDSGFEVSSRFIENGNMDELYLSGWMNNADIDEQKKEWDFYAGKFIDIVLNRQTSVVKISSSLNRFIADTVDPNKDYTPSWGQYYYVDKAFDNSGCFLFINERLPYFKPKKDLVIGFIITANYYTQIKYNVEQVQSPYPNKKLYRSESIFYNSATYNNKTYEADASVICGNLIENPFAQLPRGCYIVELVHYEPDDFTPDKTPKYYSVKIENAPENDKIRFFPITGRYTVIYKWYDYNNVGMYIRGCDTEMLDRFYIKIKVYNPADKNDISLKIETPISSYAKDESIIFDNLTFNKSVNNQDELDFVYYSTSNITPIFSPIGIGLGETVTSEDILSNQTEQSAFLKSVKQLFNLSFYTDLFKNIVFVEPRWDFYAGPIIDWSKKMDLNKSIIIEELGYDISKTISIGYKEPDYIVGKYNSDNRTVLGTFERDIKNIFAKPEKHRVENTLFYPSIVHKGVYKNAPSAELLMVNSENNADTIINFDTRVVRFNGVEELPEGELLQYPSNTTRYPKVSFVSAGLCFEDRDNIEGLHRFYDRNFEMYDKAKRITCYLHLRSVDIESFARLNERKKDFRATIILEINYEKVYCLLEEISDFKNENQSTKCVFVKKI